MVNSFGICSKPQVAKVAGSGAHEGLATHFGLPLLQSLPAWALSSHGQAFGKTLCLTLHLDGGGEQRAVVNQAAACQ